MRRAAVFLLCAGAALVPLAGVASAIGPGGWDHVGVGSTSTTASLNADAYAVNTDLSGVLLVGGPFTNAGGHANADRIAAWDGSSWSALGTGINNGAVAAIAAAGGKVYAGGTFVNAGGNPDADFLAVWNGATWGPFCTSTAPGPAFGGNVSALEVIGNTLYVGGSFQDGAAIASADYLLACDLTTGVSSSLVSSDGDVPGAVYALAADANGVLYAGGQFINMDGILAADHVAAYDGAWHAMGSGLGPDDGAVDDYVRSLAVSGTNVYVGSDALNIAGIAQADHVARWNGSAWSAVGSNTAGTDGWFPTSTFLNGVTTYGSLLFAGGSFQNANGTATADEIAYFDGTTWRPIGSNGAGNGPLPASVHALAVFRSKLYAGGNFTTAGGDGLARGIASYALRQPDARIATTSTGTYAGNNVYSTTGAGESRTRTLGHGDTGRFYVSVQNDGLVATSFTIKGSGSATGYSVSYYRGTTNITSAVKAGTYSTGTIAPRSAITIKVVVHRSTASTARSVTYLIKAKSVSGTPSDAVKAIAKAG